jgi:hypothetical protein
MQIPWQISTMARVFLIVAARREMPKAFNKHTRYVHDH